MKRLFAIIALLLSFGCDTGPGLRSVPPSPPRPAQPKPTPQPRPRPWPNCESASVEAKIAGRISPDGKTELQCDLPGTRHIKNRGGSDGAGLCVFASMHHSGDWQNEPVFAGLFEYMTHYPGGGYPDKVDRMIEQFCKDKGYPKPDYIQIEENDLDILKLACRSGLMPGVTYSYSPTGRYNGQHISHMVSLPHADDNWFAVLDNNYPGDDKYEWMSPQEFLKVASGGRKLWSVILLAKSPPMPPKR